MISAWPWESYVSNHNHMVFMVKFLQSKATRKWGGVKRSSQPLCNSCLNGIRTGIEFYIAWLYHTRKCLYSFPLECHQPLLYTVNHLNIYRHTNEKEKKRDRVEATRGTRASCSLSIYLWKNVLLYKTSECGSEWIELTHGPLPPKFNRW